MAKSRTATRLLFSTPIGASAPAAPAGSPPILDWSRNGNSPSPGILSSAPCSEINREVLFRELRFLPPTESDAAAPCVLVQSAREILVGAAACLVRKNPLAMNLLHSGIAGLPRNELRGANHRVHRISQG